MKILDDLIHQLVKPYHWILDQLSKFHQPFNNPFPLTPLQQAIMQAIEIEEVGFSEEELASMSDSLTGQTGPLKSIVKNSLEQTPNLLPPPQLNALRELWEDSSDPLSEPILDFLSQLASLTKDKRGDLVAKYKTLVGISGEDFNIIQDSLIDACKIGVPTLKLVIKVAIKTYSIAMAKNAQSAISEIANSAADLATIAQTAVSQYENYKISLKHLTLSWNSLSNSMTQYMGAVDTKTLLLSTPDRAHKLSQPAPSLDSRGTPDPISGQMISLVPGHIYKSNFGILTFTDAENKSFTSTSQEGVLIGKLVEKIKPIKALEQVLNKRLSNLITYVKKVETDLNLYDTKTKEDKFKFLTTMLKTLPNEGDQWVMSVF